MNFSFPFSAGLAAVVDVVVVVVDSSVVAGSFAILDLGVVVCESVVAESFGGRGVPALELDMGVELQGVESRWLLD